MYKVIYSENSLRDLRKIGKTTARRIIKKIEFFSQQKQISAFCKHLKGFDANIFRFRIGEYRAIFSVNDSGHIQILMILNVKHRKDIYRTQ